MWIQIKSALISGLIMALMLMGGYVVSIGDVFAVQFRPLVNVGVMSFLTTVVSLLKSTLTTQQGTALGVKIK